MKQPNVCQSCATPLRSENDLGTSVDGGKNKEYCRFCLKDGKFTDEGITIEQKIEKLVGMAVKMSIPADNARKMAQNLLPTLKRWKKA